MVLQCKMCGANLKITSKTQVVVCEYCGTSQLPFADESGNRIPGDEEAFIKRAYLALEDAEFQKADEFCEQALNINPENPQCYMAKLLAELKLSDKERLCTYNSSFFRCKNYKRFMQFADESLKNEMFSYIYKQATYRMKRAITVEDYAELIEAFRQTVYLYSDAQEKLKECERIWSELIYDKADTILTESNHMESIREAERMFLRLGGWKDARQKRLACIQKLQKLQAEVKHEEIQNKEVPWAAETMSRGKLALIIIIGGIILYAILYSMGIE